MTELLLELYVVSDGAFAARTVRQALQHGADLPLGGFDLGMERAGGDAQRLCLTRLLHSDFGLLILDEPSSALDPIAEYRIAKLIFDRSPTTTVMVAHRLSTVVDADRIYLLSDGRIIESGTHAELMAQNGKYREMFLKQAEGYLKA